METRCLHLTLFILALFFTAIYSRRLVKKKEYSGYQVFRVPATSKEAVLELEALFDLLQLDVWKHPSPQARYYDVMVPMTRNDLFKGALRDLNATFSLTISDVQRVIDEAERDVRSRRRRQSSAFRFDEYHSYKEILRWMKYFARTNSEIVSLAQVGTTFEGRRIFAFKIGIPSNVTKPVFWQDSLIHAREWITGATTLWIADRLVRDYRSGDAETTRFLERFDWLILPVWNIDGYRYSWTTDRLWRKSRSDVSHDDCRGVDLNRNFLTPNRGAGSASDYVCSGVHHGAYPFSEPETLSVASYLRTVPVGVFITIHSYAQYWLYPYGYMSEKSLDHEELSRVSRNAVTSMSDVYGTNYQGGTVEDMVYIVSGGSLDWAHRSLCVKFSFGVELRDQGRYGFVLPPQYIIPTAREYFEGMKVIAREVLNSATTTSTVCEQLIDI